MTAEMTVTQLAAAPTGGRDVASKRATSPASPAAVGASPAPSDAVTPPAGGGLGATAPTDGAGPAATPTDGESAAAAPTDGEGASAAPADVDLAATTLADPDLAAAALDDAATIRTAVARLTASAAEAGRWSGEVRHQLLADVDHAVDALAAVRATMLVAEKQAGTWQEAGDRSVVGWWARVSRSGQGTAAAEVRQAEHLDAAPAAAAAVAEGRIGLDHATVIGRVISTGSPAQREAAASPSGQELLVRMAEEHDAGTYARAVDQWAASIDPAAVERVHEAQRAGRFLHLFRTPDGTVIKGRVDSMAGDRFALALEALSPRPGPDDDRDPGQRCADALDAMAVRTLADDTKPGAHVPQQVTMILTEETWIAAQAERDRRRARSSDRAEGAAEATGRDPGRDPQSADPGALAVAATDVDPGASGYRPATLEDGTPVPVSELAAAMCDCEITRLVLSADGVPLDVGRAQRLFTGAQRRAVVGRDRECGWPQCHARARWCEVHHLRWWDRDTGPTSVDNGVLLCSFHHHEVHRQDLAITRVPLPPPGRGRAPAGGPPSTVARVTYQFRDRTGRLVAPRPPRPTATTTAATATAPTLPATSPETVPRPRVAPEATDALELQWADDPMTGMRVPALFLDR
jgi:hypothetical protein